MYIKTYMSMYVQPGIGMTASLQPEQRPTSIQSNEINQASIARADPDSQVELMCGDFRYIETARINQPLYMGERAKVRRTEESAVKSSKSIHA